MKNLSKKKITIIIICSVVATLIFIGAFYVYNVINDNNSKAFQNPSEYTLKEYDALSEEDKKAFEDSFDSFDDFSTWMTNEINAKTEMPWDVSGAKQPKDYNWEEYEKLSDEQKDEFKNSFSSEKAFDKWLRKAKSQISGLPWNEKNAKKPPEYTLDEYTALNEEEREAFSYYFESEDDFSTWMTNALIESGSVE